MHPLLMTCLAACGALAVPTNLRSVMSERGTSDSVPRAMTFVQTFHTPSGDPLSLLPLRDQQTGISHVYLASLHINITPGDITLNDDNPNSTVWNTVWSEAAQLQQSGIKVLMLLGGAAPGSYQRLCSGRLNAVIDDDYYIPLKQTLMYHMVDGLDLDIEESVNQSCPLVLLQRLYVDFGPDFILSMSPVASALQPSGRGPGLLNYTTLDTAATAPDKPNGKLINWFNCQFYNGWGDASSIVGYNAIVKHGYTPSRVVLGILDSPNDGGSGWYNISTYEKTTYQLRESWPDFGGVISWEYWDAGVNDSIANPWTWEKDESSAVLQSPGGGYGPSEAGSPISYGPAPWPHLQKSLVQAGADWLDAVQALNATAGDLSKAKQILGLSS